MAFLRTLLITIVLCLSHHQYASSVLVSNFGSFGEGMLVSWKYPLPATGSGSVGLDFLQQNDIHLHIRPYYGSSPRVVLDTRISGRWGGQERPPNFPIRRGVTNDVTVYANASGFDIYANSGAFHYLYNYRTDITQISTLTYGYAASVVHNVSVGKVLPKFRFGRVVYVSGTAPNTCINFTIDLVQTVASCYSDDDIHLRLMVKLQPPQAVALSSRKGGVWGTEETGGGMPFSPGQPFTVMIVAQLFGFEVAVNGEHLAYYVYRQPVVRDMAVMLTDVPHIQKIEYF